MSPTRPLAVELFCGAGGMSLGFERAGIHVAAAVDLDPIHMAAYAANFPGTAAIQADVGAISGAQIRKRAGLGTRQVDVLFGGPPCQGFSVGGRHKPDDPRNELLGHFARLVSELRPAYFVVENVAGLLGANHGATVAAFVEAVGRAGYHVVEPILILDARDFGVPQRRRRAFIIGYARDAAVPREPTPDAGVTPVTVWDAIGDLDGVLSTSGRLEGGTYRGDLAEPSAYAARLRAPRDVDGAPALPDARLRRDGLTGCLFTVHTQAMVERFTATPPGSYETTSRYYRLAKTGVAPTLRAGSDGAHGSYTAPRPIHPIHPRCITVREAARLHSIPDWFAFNATNWHGFRQVGNAVPPQLACDVARPIVEALASR